MIPVKPHKDITVFVVDDSFYMRSLISNIISSASGMRCIGTAADPYEAREKIKQLNPDVLTLDIEMPGMNGIDFLDKIMRLRPMPVVMVSSLSQKGADVTMQALSIGAVDCIGKPDGEDKVAQFRQDLEQKIHSASLADIRKNISVSSSFRGQQAASHTKTTQALDKKDLIAIGASTGGVEALTSMLPLLGSNIPPIVVVQHMPPLFTASLASRLHVLCEAQVTEVRDGDVMQPGRIYIAEGGKQCRIVCSGADYVIQSHEEPRTSGHCPSVDVLFQSIAEAGIAPRSIGIILTGMGADGAEGLKILREKGGHTLGQDEYSSLIYGMPRAAFALGAVKEQLPLCSISERVLRLCAGSP